MPLRHPLVAAIAGLLAGCAIAPAELRAHRQHGPASVRAQREALMNASWQQHRYEELVEALGKPKRVMSIPGGGNPPGFAVVYDLDPATGCIDAFAISAGADPVVRIYHCR